MKQVFIYALVEKLTGKTVYAGQTYHPLQRYSKLSNEHGLCILRTTTRSEALRIESQVIRAYKKRGECERNRNTGTSRRIKSPAKREVCLWRMRKIVKAKPIDPMKMQYTPEQVAFFAKCGRRGGKSTSVKKSRAARRNGKKHVSTSVASAMKSGVS